MRRRPLRLREPQSRRPLLARLEDGPRLVAIAGLSWWGTFLCGLPLVIAFGCGGVLAEHPCETAMDPTMCYVGQPSAADLPDGYEDGHGPEPILPMPADPDSVAI